MSEVNYETLNFGQKEAQFWRRELKIDRYIDAWRRPRFGEISIEETAIAAGVDLEIGHISGENQGVLQLVTEEGVIKRLIKYGPDRLAFKVRLSQDLNALTKGRVLGHELGHLLLFAQDAARAAKPRTTREWCWQERFAEFFAREFVAVRGGTLPYEMPVGSNSPGQEQLFDDRPYQEQWPYYAELEENEYLRVTGKNWGEL